MNAPHPPDTTTRQATPIRVTIQQPALPHYRVPIFRTLAGRPGITLRMVYAGSAALPNVDPEGFDALFEPMELNSLMGRPVLWCGSQLRYASKTTTDVLILSWNIRYLSLIPALIKARLTGVKTVLWGHGYSKRESTLSSGLRRWVAKLSDTLLFYNHTAAQQYLSAGFDPDRVFVALNAMDQAPIQKARESRLAEPQRIEAFRLENNLGDGPMILFVSRLEPANRLDLLIDALPRLVERVPDIQCVIIGKGEPDLTHLRRLADQRGVANHIRFPGPIYDESQLAPWFIAADVFCYPANIGLSILHAFGYGLPVVTSDRVESQNPEIESLHDGENGLLYRDNDPASLADTLAHLIEDRDLRQRLSDEAHRTVTRQFTLENMVHGMEAAIRRAANLTA